MSDGDEEAKSGGAATLVAFATPEPADRPISFNRNELNQILRVYGRMVAAGEWRDYAIDLMSEKAVFSIFRRTAEMPLYRVEKVPGLARRQGAYAVIAAGGYVMKRGHDLRQVLTVLDRRLKLVES